MKTRFWSALMFFIVACSNSNTGASEGKVEKDSKIAQARWMIGSWYNESVTPISYEVWRELDDTTFMGRSYSVRGEDTVTTEFIRLEQRGNEMSYIPRVPDQNSGMPVKFKLTSIDENRLIFENPDHDFPQKITYHLVSPDSLVAEISGVFKDQHRSRQFPMKRFK
jgi:hypothetical protein